MAEKIHENGQFWHQSLKASKFVLDIIDNGLRLPFAEPCPPFSARNNASSRNHRDFVEEAIGKLLKQKCVKQVTEPPFCCNPLTVAEGKKLRLVLDLRHVNAYLREHKFRYENLKTLEKIFEKGFYFATFDLKSGYHHIKIHDSHTGYLGFAWDFEDQTRYFIFLVMPFGLSSASYVFTKMLRPLVKKWRGQGIRCIIYVDDGIHGSPQRRTTAYDCLTVREDLENAGYTLNEEKSFLYPSQTGTWLGFHIDTANLILSVPDAKISKLLAGATEAIKHNHTTARKISRVAGQIISMGPGLGPISRLLTRKMYAFIDAAPSWDNFIVTDREVKDELRFWVSNINEANGYHLKRHHAHTKVVYSDASEHGYGGYVVQNLGKIIAKGSFTAGEKASSSTHRELLAVEQVLTGLLTHLRHESVLWYTDNWNVSRILEVGSSKNDLQDLALNIFALCVQNDVKILPCWIPREENQEADEISKHRDTDDWAIDLESFHFIQKKFGRLEVDRFADPRNTKLPRFDSRYHCTGCETVNTFTANWSHTFNWLCPPIALIAATLKHAKLCQARGVLMVPEWPSAYYWPLLTPNGAHFYPFVRDYLVLDPYYSNNSESSSVFQGFASFRSLALLIDFSDAFQ